MHRLFRLSAILTVVLLILAACSSNNGGGSTAADQLGGSDRHHRGRTPRRSAPPIRSAASSTARAIPSTSEPRSSSAAPTRPSASTASTASRSRSRSVARSPAMTSRRPTRTAAAAPMAAPPRRTSSKADPSIVAVVGTSCSSAGVPAAQILSQAGILLVSPSNTAPSLTDPATHQPFYARTAHNDKVQGAAMAEFACTVLKVTSAATIHDGSPYAQQLQQVFADNFKSKCSGTITDQEAITRRPDRLQRGPDQDRHQEARSSCTTRSSSPRVP